MHKLLHYRDAAGVLSDLPCFLYEATDYATTRIGEEPSFSSFSSLSIQVYLELPHFVPVFLSDKG